MKINIKTIIAVLLAGAASGIISAQNTYSGYFTDNYLYRHQMNPAYGNCQNFVGFPALGNLNIGMQGNLHLSDVLYNIDGRTSLFTNPKVDAAEFMSHIHDKNRIGTDFKVNILNGGWKAWGGYNTVGISVVGNLRASLPGSLFSLLKEGVENREYDIKNLRAHAGAYAEIALNHSRDIRQVPGLRVGAAVKFLIGAGSVDARFNDARLVLGKDSWDITANADLYANVKGLKFKHDWNHDVTPAREYVSGAELDGFGLNGFGLGFDLGATYSWRDFTFSAAVLDLGFISWGESHHASTDGTVNFQTSKYEFDVNSDDDRDAFDEMKDDLTQIYQLKDMGKAGSRAEALAATLNFGVEYELPYYRRLHFGLLNTTRIDGPYTWTEFRLGATVRPVDCLSASINMAAGTFGVGMGWMLNLNLRKGFNLFVGMDRIPGKLAKQGVPLNSNGELNFGINFPF